MERARVPLAPLQPSPLATQQARPRVRAASRSPSRSASPARRKKAKPSSLWKQVVNLAFWGSPQTQQHEAAPEAPMDEEPAAEDDEEEVDVDAADSAADSSTQLAQQLPSRAGRTARKTRCRICPPNLPSAENRLGRCSTRRAGGRKLVRSRMSSYRMAMCVRRMVRTQMLGRLTKTRNFYPTGQNLTASTRD
jgi:hypothetical protein